MSLLVLQVREAKDEVLKTLRDKMQLQLQLEEAEARITKGSELRDRLSSENARLQKDLKDTGVKLNKAQFQLEVPRSPPAAFGVACMRCMEMVTGAMGVARTRSDERTSCRSRSCA